MLSAREKDLAEQVIRLHDGTSYDLLREMSLPSPSEDIANTVTEEMYRQSCDEIRVNLGEVSSIEFIDSLQRKNSELTLWKVKYTLSEDEVCWGIGLDRDTQKVTDVLVNW